MIPNKDYTGLRKPENGGLTFKFFNSNADSAYSDVQAGNLDVLDHVHTVHLPGDREGRRGQGIPGAGSLSSPTSRSRRVCRTSGARKGRRVARRSRWPRTARRSATRSSNGARTPAKDFTSPAASPAGPIRPSGNASGLQPGRGQAPVGRRQQDQPRVAGASSPAQRRRGQEGVQRGEHLNQLKNTLEIYAEPSVYATFDELRTVITVYPLHQYPVFVPACRPTTRRC